MIPFLEKCLPQSGRTLDLKERHSLYLDIEKNFAYFWCMFDRSSGKNKLIGTIAVRDLGAGRCELKSVYLDVYKRQLYTIPPVELLRKIFKDFLRLVFCCLLYTSRCV